jgi:DNA polymerase I-like protein with 3'-5' exonuclease and polymerase domains
MGLKDKTPAKTINLGIMYGMGGKRMYTSHRILWDRLAAEENNGESGEQYSDRMLVMYKDKMPVVQDTMDWVQQVVRQQGYIIDVAGRVHHKPKPYWKDGKLNDGLYKMTNYWDQGGCGGILKHALITAYKEGLYDTLKLHLTVHDENVLSAPYNKEGTEALQEFQNCMDMSYAERLQVHMWSEMGVGPNWGYKHSEDIWENMKKGIFDRSWEHESTNTAI